MAKGMDKMIAEMRRQAEELAIAVRVFDRMSGGNGKAMNNVRTAMGMFKGGRGKKNGQPVEGEPIAPIEGLRDLPRTEAVKLALKAANRPMRALEIAKILQSSGRTDDRKAVQLSLLQMVKLPKRHHIKKAKKGYGGGYVITA